MTQSSPNLISVKLLHKLEPTKKQSSILIKLSHWEYWPFGIVYIPIFFYWFYLCAKARNFFFFTASNPSIENGGFVMESKADIYATIPSEYYPKTLLINIGLSAEAIRLEIERNEFYFPLIVKPDIGGKGRGVKKVNNIEDAVAYILSANFPMLVQALVKYKNEVGIFYYRYPWQQNGKISGIVAKEFATVVGNGIDTIENLILQNRRYRLQLSTLAKMKELNLKEILPVGIKKILVPFGNHARGAKFIDASNKISEKLEKSIDSICQKVPSFYFGRLDIMYNSWEELEDGKNISIIELNGAGSEPTHIYDPTHSIFFAWKEIIRHLNILYKISVYNHRHNGIAYLPFAKGLKMLRDVKKVEKKLDSLL